MKGFTIGQIICLSDCTINFTSDRGTAIRVVCSGDKTFGDNLVFFRIGKSGVKEAILFNMYSMGEKFGIKVNWGDVPTNQTTFYANKEQLCKTDVMSAVSCVEQYIETCEAQLSDLKKQFSI